jgi:hypothetical protein
MVQGLEVKDGQDADTVRRQFDNALGVSSWPTPGTVIRPQKARPAGAPIWWEDDEEASASFLSAQGVNL